MTDRIRRLKLGMWVMAAVAWATVFSGTFIVYPWYRAKPAEGADLINYPRYFLLDNPATAAWHTFGMEWKEHVAWITPIAATVVAFAISYYGPSLVKKLGERRALTIFFVVSFVAAVIAGVFGAFINKVAPIR